MREQRHPDPVDVDLPVLMHALSDPLRLRIVEILTGEGETTCRALRDRIGVSKSAASYHFRVLREAGMIRTRTAGREHLASLRREELAHSHPGIVDAVVANLRHARRTG